MAISTRTMYQGDTWPPLRGEAKDDAGNVLDLTTAHTLALECVGAHGNIIGTPVADTPPIADADGIHHWNWHYTFALADTAVIDDYEIYLKVTWDVAGNEVQTFGKDSLSVVAKPV